MIIRKSRDEIAIMRRAGRVTAQALAAVRAAVRPGVSLRQLDRVAEDVIRGAGGAPSFKGYQPHFASSPFPGTICASINDVIVHGIPDQTRLREGDILSVDCGAIIDGYHGDSAITIPVGEIDGKATDLLEATEQALWAGIEQARTGNRLSDIGHAVGQVAHSRGYGVMADFGGHGVGRALHEDPSVDNDGPPGRGIRLREGLVIAIEPMFALGSADYEVRSDGWALATRDGSLAAHFEHTIALTDDGPEVLTLVPPAG